MKSIIAPLALAAGISLASAQTLDTNTNPPAVSGPAVEAVKFLSMTSSNWMLAGYGIYDSGTKTGGGGLAAAYKLSDFVVPTLRLDYLNREVWMPSADLQLQAPLTIMGKVTVIPFAFTGIATPVSGRGEDNGSAVGLFGSGAAVRITKHFDLVGDVEKWTGFEGLQYRFGVLYKF